MDIRRKQALNESPFSPTRVNYHSRRTPPLRDLLPACGNRTNYVPASTRGGVEDIKISRQLSADGRREGNGRSDKECGGNLRNLHSTPENGLRVWEYGKGDGLNQNRPRRATRAAAKGSRWESGVSGYESGWWCLPTYTYAELSIRTTTGLWVRALAQVLDGTSRTDDHRRACVHIIKDGPCEDLFVVSARWIISFRLSSPVYDLA